MALITSDLQGALNDMRTKVSREYHTMQMEDAYEKSRKDVVAQVQNVSLEPARRFVFAPR